VLVALLRHGEGARRDAPPPSESPSRLSPRGRAQAGAARRFLAALDAPRIVSSSSPSALETAAIVAAGRPVETVPELAEPRLGTWEGCAAETLPELLDLLTHADGAPPEGEFLAGLLARARAALDAVLDGHSGDAVVVSHRLVNTILLADVLGLPLRESVFLQQSPGCVNLLRRRGDSLTVLMLNVDPLDPLHLGAEGVSIA
jgi:broad specificity phosphatase PhoE